MAKKYKITTKRTPLIKLVAKIVKKAMGPHEIINLNQEPLPDQCIILGTHNGMRGPFVYQAFMPKFCVPWGAHEMTGNYKERWNYLYHVFYQQKLKLSKPQAWFKATFLAIVSKFFYNKIGLIGTYQDARQLSVIRRSVMHIEQNVPIMLFPENSSKGYFEILEECHSGFVLLAQAFYKKHNIDLPVYPTYYSKKFKRIVIDKPMYVKQLTDSGMSRKQIAEYTKKVINSLQDRYNVEPQQAQDTASEASTQSDSPATV